MVRGLMANISRIGGRFGLPLISVIFLCIHTGLFFYDLNEPGAFLRGDRSEGRLETITSLLTATSPFDVVMRGGVPGDYIFHALLYRLGGPYLIIFAQVLLQYVIVVATYLVARRLTQNTAVTMATCLLLMVMPGTLLNPHVLTTETWYTAFLSLGTFAFCLALDPKVPNISTGLVLGGFGAFALASFVRPQGLLIPLAVTLFLLATDRREWTRIVLGLGVGYCLFPISWIILRLGVLGDLGLGVSPSVGLGPNLLLRSNRILSLPIDPDPPDAQIGILEFLNIAATHPSATLRTFYADALNLLFNPGANHLFGYYLGLFQSPGVDRYYWREVMDRSHAFGLVQEMLKQNSLFLLTFAIWSIIHAAVIIGVGIVLFRAVRHRNMVPRWIWLVFTVIAVSVVSVFAAGLVRWAHRSGIEPLLALLAAWGFFSKAANAGMPAVAVPLSRGLIKER